MSHDNVDRYKDLLTKLGNSLKNDHSMTRLKLRKYILLLESVFSKADLSLDKQKQLIKYCKKSHFLSIFHKAYEKYEIDLEKESSKYLIRHNSSGIKNEIGRYPYYQAYLKAIRAEKNLAQIKHGDKVAFVGSGPLPISALLLYELLHVRIDCFEKDKESAKLSKIIIDKLSYAKSIKIFYKNAIKQDFSNYSVVILAVMAEPKSILLKTIWQSIKKGSRIIYRSPSIARQAYYKDTNKVLDNYKKFERKRIKRKNSSTLSLIVKN
jgi:hypothetical protein